jgi:hypothetical protein
VTDIVDNTEHPVDIDQLVEHTFIYEWESGYGNNRFDVSTCGI